VRDKGRSVGSQRLAQENCYLLFVVYETCPNLLCKIITLSTLLGSVMVCHNCGREIKVIGKVLRKDECPHCKADMHCCKNCRFFDPGRSKQCSEPQADYVSDKLKANFCEFFE